MISFKLTHKRPSSAYIGSTTHGRTMRSYSTSVGRMGEVEIKRTPFTQRPEWCLFVVCLLVAIQSSLTTGFVNSSYSTLQKLFQFSSTFTGFVEGSYHMAVLIFVVPVSHFGRQTSKPVLLAVGALIIAIGSFVFASAELLRPNYNMESIHNGTMTDVIRNCDGDGSLQKYLFIIGMFLIGIGSTPVQTVGVTYLDESVSSKKSGIYLGIFFAVSFLSPAIGFVLSGLFLMLPIHFRNWDMKPSDESFKGAWWAGFSLELLLGVAITPLLINLPMNPNKNRAEEIKLGKEMLKPKPLKTCLLELLTNKTYLCLMCHGSLTHFTLAGLTAFMPKYFEIQYSLKPQIAAFIVGGIAVPAAAIGSLISGYIIKRFNLKCDGTIKLTAVAQLITMIVGFCYFMMKCPAQIIGIEDVSIEGLPSTIKLNASSCYNLQPHISCLNKKFTIFNPCMLECKDKERCYSSLTMGACNQDCSRRLPGYILFFFLFFFGSCIAVPKVIALLRLVEDDLRSISIGLQWVFFRMFGMIPGPLLYGKIFDLACKSWVSNSKSLCTSTSFCSVYLPDHLQMYIIIATFSTLLAGEISLLFAIKLYHKNVREKEIDQIHIPNELPKSKV